MQTEMLQFVVGGGGRVFSSCSFNAQTLSLHHSSLLLTMFLLFALCLCGFDPLSTNKTDLKLYEL